MICGIIGRRTGGSIRADLNFLLPYAVGEKSWSYKSLNGVESGGLVEPLLLAAIHYHSSDYLHDAEKFEQHPRLDVLLLQQYAQEKLSSREAK